MPESGITYTRVVTWLKIGLPIAAPGLLSTLFLFARDRDITGDVPFAKGDLEDRAQGQQLTKPHFAGMTTAGDRVSVTAAAARPDGDEPRLMVITGISSRIDLATGEHFALASGEGWINNRTGEVEIAGRRALENLVRLFDPYGRISHPY